MSPLRKIVLHSTSGLRSGLDELVREWILGGVEYVGVVGLDAAKIEDAIDEICESQEPEPYFMVTVAHDSSESLEDALFLARVVPEDRPVQVDVVAF